MSGSPARGQRRKAQRAAVVNRILTIAVALALLAYAYWALVPAFQECGLDAVQGVFRMVCIND